MLMTLRRMWIQMTADRKRFGVLCAAVCLGMLLWARLIVVSRMPRMAIADENQKAAEKGQAPGNGQATSSGNSSQEATVAPIKVDLSTEASRDPFVISPAHFPNTPEFAGPLQDAGKSQTKPAEEPYQIEARTTALLQGIADRLHLEAAVSGSMAVINGKTYRSGDLIAAAASGGGTGSVGTAEAAVEPVRFRLTEVKQRSAVLECQGRRFEIQMALPRGGGGDGKS